MLTANPFADGDPLVRPGKENKRMRILTHAEEASLLAQCTGPRKHLCLPLVFALDTALRAREQFLTRLANVDLDQGFILVAKRIAKIGEERIVPISDRLRTELLARISTSIEGAEQATPDSRLFYYLAPGEEVSKPFNRPKRSFAMACRLAGIQDFHWHDLRHTATMRMLEAESIRPL